MILILVTLFGRPMQKVSYWTASSLPVLLWYYFFGLSCVYLLIGNCSLTILRDNVEGQVLDCFFIVCLYLLGSAGIFLRITFLSYS